MAFISCFVMKQNILTYGLECEGSFYTSINNYGKCPCKVFITDLLGHGFVKTK